MPRLKYFNTETNIWEYVSVNGAAGQDGYTPVKGVDYFDGKNGVNGKSAYEYAQEAGYTGTEEEFVQKLAEEAPKAFYVTVTDNGDETGVMDKSYDEIYTAYEAGRPVIVTINKSEDHTIGVALCGEIDGTLAATVAGMDGMMYIVLFLTEECVFVSFPFAPVTSVNGQTGAVNIEIPTVPSALKNPNALSFTGAVTGSYDGSSAKTVNIPAVPASLKSPYALTINGTTYDGSTAVNMTDIINNMIAAKLEEIMNAEEVAF